MVFAFNMMRRVLSNFNADDLEIACSYYEEFRIEHSKNVSLMNKGRKMSNAFKADISMRMSGKVLVEVDGKRLYIEKEKYDPRIHKRHSLGRKHSYETKKKMSEHGIKGKTLFRHKDTGEERFFDIDPGCDWIKGKDDSFKKEKSMLMSQMKHFVNKETGERIRSIENPDPSIFVEGRGEFKNCFEGSSPFINIQTGLVEVVKNEDRLSCHYIWNENVFIVDGVPSSLSHISEITGIPKEIVSSVVVRACKNPDYVLNSKTFKNITAKEKYKHLIGLKLSDFTNSKITVMCAKDFVERFMR